MPQAMLDNPGKMASSFTQDLSVMKENGPKLRLLFIALYKWTLKRNMRLVDAGASALTWTMTELTLIDNLDGLLRGTALGSIKPLSSINSVPGLQLLD